MLCILPTAPQGALAENDFIPFGMPDMAPSIDRDGEVFGDWTARADVIHGRLAGFIRKC